MIEMTFEFVQADTPTSTGLIYSTSLLEKLCKENDNVPGFLNKPDDLLFYSHGTGGIKYNLSAISHQVKNLRLIDGLLMGDILILDTPLGKLLGQVVSSGAGAFKLCGMGSAINGIVEDDYKLLSINYVFDM